MKEKTLKINEKVLLEVLEHLHEAVYLTDRDETVIYTNHAAEVLEKLPREEMIGKTISQLYSHTELSEEINAPSLSVLHTGKARVDENIGWFSKDGTEINAITSSYPVLEGDAMCGVISVSENIEELRSRLVQLGAFRRKNTYRLQKKLMKNGTGYIFDDILGESEVMKDTIAMARRFASKKMPVMIYGETGTGKEMIAQSIHNASPFVNGPFVPINCAAIPENLLESTLFGTVKGAFTGAVDNPGLFEKAEKGTIFLDEINSMPIALQAKILRVLQEKEVQRIGDAKMKKVHCRIISATNKTPEAAIQANEMREDLFYRLSTGYVIIPSLKERGHDLELLIHAFVAKCNEELGSNVSGLSSELMSLFRSYAWPGNIRELSNAIESAMNMVQEEETLLDVQHLPAYLKNHFQDRIAKMPNAYQVFSHPSAQGRPYATFSAMHLNGDLKSMVGEYERDIIERVLSYNHGNLTHTSASLGLTRQGLMKKIRKYGIDLPRFKVRGR